MMNNSDANQARDINSIFMELLTPEILLAHININNNEWVEYSSNWFYKVDKRDIALPFQRKLYITNDLKNITISQENVFEVSYLNHQKINTKTENMKSAEKMIRTILNLENSIPIEDWTEKAHERTIVEEIIASNHIKILSII